MLPTVLLSFVKYLRGIPQQKGMKKGETLSLVQ